jgi:hypothetical protein
MIAWPFSLTPYLVRATARRKHARMVEHVLKLLVEVVHHSF